MKRYITHIVILIGGAYCGFGQNANRPIASFDYMLVPDIGETQVQKYQATANFGRRFKKSALGIGLNYSHYDFVFNGMLSDAALESFNEVHSVGLRVFYLNRLSEKWTFTVALTPSIQSTFNEGVTSEDLVFGALSTFSKRWGTVERNGRVTFGILFGTQFGEPQFFPAFSLEQKLNVRWSYTLGVPRTALRYQVNERHQLALTAGIEGFYANNASAVSFQNTTPLEDTKFAYRSLQLGFRHQFKIQPNWSTDISIGYATANRLEFLDNDNDVLYDLEPDGSLYINMGIKFNLNKKAIDESKKE